MKTDKKIIKGALKKPEMFSPAELLYFKLIKKTLKAEKKATKVHTAEEAA